MAGTVSRLCQMRLFLLSFLFISSAAALPLLKAGGRDYSSGSKSCWDEGCSRSPVLAEKVDGSIRSIFDAFLGHTTVQSLTSFFASAPDAVNTSSAQPDLPSIKLSLPFQRRADHTSDAPFSKVLIVIGSIAGGLALVLGVLWLVAYLIGRQSEKGTKRKLKSKVPSEAPFEPTMESYSNVEARSPISSGFRLPLAHDPFADHNAVGNDIEIGTLDVPRSPRPRSPRPASPPV
ncbi:hypothetical protein VKT23_017560 [Stygiomarasmius scandens]|uniref:Uncharacterized protein n=1 Tax=Marasmiellus scandens TaxID=2682957 RepID=A0ABR1IRT4_9AGAR